MSEHYTYVLAVGIVVALIWGGHYFTKYFWPDGIHPVAAYCYGVGTILLGVGIWLLPSDGLRTFDRILGICVAAGIMTGGLHWYDHTRHLEGKDAVNDRTSGS